MFSYVDSAQYSHLWKHASVLLGGGRCFLRWALLHNLIGNLPLCYEKVVDAPLCRFFCIDSSLGTCLYAIRRW